MEYYKELNLDLAKQFNEVYDFLEKSEERYKNVNYYDEFGYGIFANFFKENNFNELHEFYEQHKDYLSNYMRMLTTAPVDSDKRSGYSIHLEKWTAHLNCSMFGMNKDAVSCWYEPKDIETVKEKQVETDEAWYCQDSSLFKLVESHVLLDKSMIFRANSYHTVHNNSKEKRCVVSWPFKELDWDRIVEYAGKNFN
jgi:hypothetical protein